MNKLHVKLNLYRKIASGGTNISISTRDRSTFSFFSNCAEKIRIRFKLRKTWCQLYAYSWR